MKKLILLFAFISSVVSAQNTLPVTNSSTPPGPGQVRPYVTNQGKFMLQPSQGPAFSLPSQADLDQKVTLVTDSLQLKQTASTALVGYRIRYDNADWVLKSGNIASDGGTRISTPYGKYYEREIQDDTWESKWFNDVADFNEANNQGTDASVILNRMLAAAPSGTIIRLRPNAKYRIGSTLIIRDKTVRIDLNGSTLYQTSNAPIISYLGSFEWSNITATIQASTVQADDSPAVPSLRITPSSLPSGIRKGDVIKLTSEDVVPGTKAVNGTISSRMGQFLVVAKVEGGSIYTTTIPEELDQYKTNIKIHKLSENTFAIYNGKVSSIYSTESPSWTSDLIAIRNCKFFEAYDITSLLSWSGVINPRGLYMPKIHDCTFTRANTKDPVAHGYGIRDMGCQYGLYYNLRGNDVRHVYTTNQNTIQDLSQIESFGRSMFSTVSNSIGVGCANASFDTHEGAYGIIFDNLFSYGVYTGNSSTGDGFSMRGRNLIMRNCVSRNVRFGAHLAHQFTGTVQNVRIENCQFYGDVYGLRIDTDPSATDVSKNIQVIGGIISGGQRATSLRNTQVSFKDVELRCVGSANAAYFSSALNSELEYNNCTFSNPDSTGTTIRVFHSEGDNVKTIVRGGWLKFNKSVDILISGTNFTGSAIVYNINSQSLISTPLSGTTSFSTASYSYNLKTLGSNAKESFILQTVSANGVTLNTAGINSDEIFVSVLPSGSNRTIGTLPNGFMEGQRLRLYCNSNTFTVTINTNTNLSLATSGIIYPRGTMELFWTQGTWREVNYYNTTSMSTPGSVPVTTTTQILARNTWYRSMRNTGLVAFTLPTDANSSVDDFVKIQGYGSAGWTLGQPEAGTIIRGLNTNTATTAGTTGSVASTDRYDYLLLRKIGTNEWVVEAQRGTLTVN